MSQEVLPAGKSTIRYVQTMTSRPFDGGGALYLGTRKLAERSFERCNFATSYDGFSIGEDSGNQVSTAYTGRNPFTGTIKVVRITIDTRPTTIFEQARFLREIKIRI